MRRREQKVEEDEEEKMEEDDQDDTGSTTKRRPLKSMPPNHILVAEELPAECTQETLQQIFANAAGLKEIRMFASKNVAFVEFDSEYSAGVALSELNNKMINESSRLFINYAKK